LPLTIGPTQSKFKLTANPTWAALDAFMNVTNPLGSDEIEKSSEVEVRRNARELEREVEGGDLKASTEELAALLRRLSGASIREIDQLINQLQKLRTQLRTTSDRIQKDIAEYAELSQQTTQLTSIIVDSVTKLPRGSYR
jgi:uncharacterized protein (DUF3084 family)